jgi:regulator of RNase E activity RraA
MPDDPASRDEQTLALLARASAATIASELTRAGVGRCCMRGVRPIPGTAPRFVGPAYTLRYLPLREDVAPPGALGDPDGPQRLAIETAPAGGVLVIDARREAEVAVIGAILATRLARRGVAALVTDGGVRDSAEIAAMALPVHCAGAAMPETAAEHMAIDAQVPVACGGVSVFPQDILVGDADGVVVVPRALAAEIAQRSVEHEALESFIAAKVDGGAGTRGLYPPDASALAEFHRRRSGSGK